MKNQIITFISQAGHSVSGYEHKLLEKFAAFIEVQENAPVVETPAPVEPVEPVEPVAIVADTPVEEVKAE